MRLSPLFFIFLSKLTKSQCPPSDLPNPNSPNKQCDCDDGNIKTEVISGAIWPAWGTLNDQGIILPPANCSGTTCWRANVTCSVRVSGNVSKQPTWTWNWIPTVQYPLGDKNFYSLPNPPLQKNSSNLQCSAFTLPGSINDVNRNYGTNFESCPTFYYQGTPSSNAYSNYDTNVKWCPVNQPGIFDPNSGDSKGETTFSSTMIIYDYLNEQNDGFYTCSLDQDEKPTVCCQPEVYYASPNWNGWCWFGMFYGVVGGGIMLCFLASFVISSDIHHKQT